MSSPRESSKSKRKEWVWGAGGENSQLSAGYDMSEHLVLKMLDSNIMWAKGDLPYTLSWKHPLKSAITVSRCRGQTAPVTLSIFPPLSSFAYFYLFLAVLGLQCCAGFSAVVLSGDDSLVAAHELLSLQSPGPRAQAQQSRCTGFVVPRHVGYSWIRDQTRVSCTGRRVLHHRAARETPSPTCMHLLSVMRL